MDRQDQQAAFFSAEARRSPYLACWHQAFASRPGATGPLVELWFDRGRLAPRHAVIQLPARDGGHVLDLTALYLAARINNTLCVWGARRVTIRSRDESLARDLLQRVTHLLLYQAEVFSDLTLYFIFALIEKHYGERLAIDTSPAQADRLARWRPEAACVPPSLSRPDRLTALAINIGLHKTSCGLVSLDGAGGHGVSRLHRQPTWPDGQPHCYPSLAPAILGHLAATLGPLPPETEAVCLSLATPVLGGEPQAVAQIGLAADCDQETADAFGASLVAAARSTFPGLPVFCCNDAEAQGLFASRFDRQQSDCRESRYAANLLSIRLGACPSVSYIDASGRNLSRLNEYAWLATRIHGPRRDAPLLSTISRAISFHGLACLAHELGLLEKYRVMPGDAPVFFHRLCIEGSPAEQHDALRIYHVLGAHIAMLFHEIDRDTPVRHARLLGSAANRIDAPIFAAIRDGFAGFIDRHALPFESVDFSLAEGASAQASLVGAAVGYADAVAGYGRG
jgi:hypothetical protein